MTDYNIPDVQIVLFNISRLFLEILKDVSNKNV